LIAPELQQAILDWYATSGRDLPWRHTRDPYAILVSEIMLQQTQVDRVLPKYAAFLGQFPDFAALAAAPTGEVIRAWQGLGYNLRAVRLQRIAREVVREHQGRLPDTVEGLLALDGIGRYTASAVACFAFGRSEPVLDTNVRRVLGRMALGPDGPKSASAGTLWKVAEEALPRQHAYNWNQALMDLGSQICLERNPMCLLCPAQPWCKSAGQVAPVLRERSAPYTTRRETPFTGSTRYYRGRIVECLRALPAGATLPLADLGPAIRADYGEEHLPWLRDLIARLERDGLLVSKPDATLALPDHRE
jgi:A/G-specific adenine glycosylase